MTPSSRFCIICFILVVVGSAPVLSNQYDPHLFPSTGPFFEGWYLRFVDHANARSFGVLFGIVLPEDDAEGSNLAFTGLIRDVPGIQGQGRLLDWNCFPPVEDVSLTVKDHHPVDRNPDFKSPADFTWRTETCGEIVIKPDSGYVNVTVDHMNFYADFGSAVPWGEQGRGPGGWLDSLPLPLHWFVYSLGSEVHEYRWTDSNTGVTYTGSGKVHMEKNWGESFPRGWIWAEGLHPGSDIYFTLTYGPVDFGPLPVNGHLVGYRNLEKDITIDFRPDNSIVMADIRGCEGFTNFTIISFRYKLVVEISAPLWSFSECLYGPMQNGFRPVCAESFRSETKVSVFQRHWLSYTLLDEQIFSLGALEFGGNYSCNGTCSAQTENRELGIFTTCFMILLIAIAAYVLFYL